MTYEIGPMVTLIDGPNFSFIWTERRELIRRQMEDADIVAISRVDELEEKTLSQIKDTLKHDISGLKFFSIYNPDSLEKILAGILGSKELQ